MTLSLWTGAGMPNQKVADMVRDADKTQSFIDNALTPLVEALAGRNGLGAWWAILLQSHLLALVILK